MSGAATVFSMVLHLIEKQSNQSEDWRRHKFCIGTPHELCKQAQVKCRGRSRLLNLLVTAAGLDCSSNLFHITLHHNMSGLRILVPVKRVIDYAVSLLVYSSASIVCD
jgi:hypothetical protein